MVDELSRRVDMPIEFACSDGEIDGPSVCDSDARSRDAVSRYVEANAFDGGKSASGGQVTHP